MGFHNTALIGSSGQGGGYNLESSLRFRSSASAYLSRTPASSSNRKTWTWSGWVKRGTLAIDGSLLDAANNDQFRFRSDDTFSFSFNNTLALQTTQRFRDPSAWYHFVLTVDTTQATSSNRVKLYVNGEQVTAFSTASYPSQNLDGFINSANAHYIGRLQGGAYYLDGYLAEVNFIDGQQLTPSDFGEYDEDTGVWKPKEYEGTYGTNGYYLDMSTSGSTITDQSGNSNNWAATNMNLTTSSAITYDIINDVPTLTSEDKSNFCTLNPLSETSNLTTSNGNLTVANSTTESQHRLIRGTMGMSTGKYYWEANVNNSANVDMVGIINSSYNGSDNQVVNASDGFGYGYSTSNGNWYAGGGWTSDGTTPAAFPSSGIIGVAFDADNGKLYFSRNNTWINSANPSAGTGANATYTGSETEFLPALSIYYNTGSWTINFGQRPFAYTPPTGYKKLNTYNLPDSTIADGSQYMNSVLYTGNDSTQSITGVGFSPDLVWIKNKNGGQNNYLQDSVRGATNYLVSNNTGAENQYSGLGASAVTSFGSDGFLLGTDAIGMANTSALTYVAWNWRGSDSSAVSNTDGTITSTVSANTTSGFSIVAYTGTGSNATIGHGLSQAADMFIIKNRDTSVSDAWRVWHKDLSGANYRLVLNRALAQASATGLWQNIGSDNTRIYLDTDARANGSGNLHICYAFHSVEGFSKFGSYTGNGSTDGSFIYTGFRPAFIIIKCTSNDDSWYMLDTSRSTYNATNHRLFANSSSAESTGDAVDILSNGFKNRSVTTVNNLNGATYIYMAFAENPFKHSLAR